MHYRTEAQGDWGSIQEDTAFSVSSEMLAMADGSKLFVRSWKTASPTVLLLLHGLGAHSGWFIDMGNELAARGLNVYTVDHRGFGRSEGHPGHIDSYQLYVKDIKALVEEIGRRHAGARIFMLGHSMGGIFTAHYAANYGQTLAGTLFLNPWIQDNTRLPLRTTLSILWGGLRGSRRAWQVAGGHEGMTTNAEAIAMLEADPYWRRSQTSSFLLQILRMRLAVPRLARRITIPTLVMQAEADKAVLPAATRQFYEALASRDKTWKSYPNYAHDTEFEPERQQLDDDITSWLQKHSR